MTDRILTAWKAYLWRAAPFVSTAAEEPAAEVAAKRAYFEGFQTALDMVWEKTCFSQYAAEALISELDAELALFARDVSEGRK